MKQLLFLFLLGTFYNTSTEEQIAPIFPITKPIIQISIPKCGTHLLMQCIQLLTGKKSIMNGPWWNPKMIKGFYEVSAQELDYLTALPDHQFWSTHLIYKPEYEALLKQRDCALFFIYRDPRDQIVSLFYYMKKYPKFWPSINKTTINNAIFAMIESGTLYNNHPPATGILDLYNCYLPWLNNSEILSIKFEDLVGETGGGNNVTQYETVKKIAQRLGVDASEKTLDYVIAHLFGENQGNFNTFRKGQIGEWKEHFTQAHKDSFKKHAGQLLIDLGYEKDLNW